MSLKLNRQEKDIYTQAREQLYNDFIQDMSDSAVDIELSTDDLEKSNKKYKNLMMKKIVLYSVVVLTFILIIIFATYKTFFKHEYTGEEIAQISNIYNNKTNFPESGVQGYLEKNIDKLLKEKLVLASEVEKVNLGTPIITKINPKNDNLANVYFYINIRTNIAQDLVVNAVLPILWNAKNQEYNPSGNVIFTPNMPNNTNTEESDNPLLSFESIPEETEEMKNKSMTFVDNFFTMLYNGQDITPYYKSNVKLDIPSNAYKYDGMTDYFLYKNTNQNGYNTTAKITLKTSNGVTYITQKYLTIEKSGESWIVTAVL